MAASRKNPKTKEVKKKESKERNPLKRMVNALDQARKEFAEASSSLEVKKAMFEKTNMAAIQRADAAELAVKLNDETLRNFLVEEFQTKGEIAFGPGLDIKMRQTLTVHDPEAAFDWALKFAPCALTLELSTLRLLTQHLDVVPDTIAVMTETPTAYIAKDLARAVEALGNA